MSNMKKKTDKHPAQMSLFSLLDELQNQEFREEEGRMNMRTQLRNAINSALKKCRLSRWEVAGKMSHLLGVEISKFMLDAWTAESKVEHRFPAEYLPAFCAVTGDNGPLSLLAEKAGLYALPGPDALRSEIQRIDEEAKRLAAEKRKRMQFLKEMEG